MLDLRNLQLRQGTFTLGADFHLAPDARASVIGPSGGGKSTLLAAIAGFLPPSAGAVRWDGANMPAHPGARPVAMLFQDHNLFPHLSVSDNVGLGISPNLRLTRADQARVAAVLDQVGLAGQGHKRPAALSGGQQSRAALARLLLRRKPLVLLDEPFAALGPAMKDEMLALLAQVLAEIGAAALMVTHDPGDAQAFAADCVLVADGRAHAPQALAPLLADPPQALADYLGARLR